MEMGTAIDYKAKCDKKQSRPGQDLLSKRAYYEPLRKGAKPNNGVFLQMPIHPKMVRMYVQKDKRSWFPSIACMPLKP